MDRFERVDFVKKFLHENQDLSSYEAADKLDELHGIFLTYRTIAKYRQIYKIPYSRHSPLFNQIKADYEKRVDFGTSNDMAKKYGCSRSYASQALRVLKGTQKKRIANPEPVKVVTLEPVRVNTMAHAVHQLIRCSA